MLLLSMNFRYLAGLTIPLTFSFRKAFLFKEKGLFLISNSLQFLWFCSNHFLDLSLLLCHTPLQNLYTMCFSMVLSIGSSYFYRWLLIYSKPFHMLFGPIIALRLNAVLSRFVLYTDDNSSLS